MKRSIFYTLSVAGILTLAAIGCGGGDTPYSPIVQGNGGGGDFAIAIAPAKQNMVNTGGLQQDSRAILASSVSFSVSLTPSGGLQGPVNLTATNPNAQLFTTSFNPATLNLGGTTQQTSILTVRRLANTNATGDQVFTITASGGGKVHAATATVTLVNAAPDFAVSAVPTTVTAVSPGKGFSTADFDVKVASLNGFNGTINLSAQGLDNSFTKTFTPASLTLGPAGTADVLLHVSTTRSSGTYPFTVQAQSGTVIHVAPLTLKVVFDETNFNIRVNPQSQTLNTGQITSAPGMTNTVAYTVTVSSVNGFNGTVSLQVLNQPINGVTWSFDQNSVTLNGANKQAILTVHVTNTVSRTYEFVIAGTSGTQTTTASAELRVNPILN